VQPPVMSVACRSNYKWTC